MLIAVKETPTAHIEIYDDCRVPEEERQEIIDNASRIIYRALMRKENNHE